MRRLAALLLVGLLAALAASSAGGHHRSWHDKGPKPPEPPPPSGIPADCSVDVTAQIKALIDQDADGVVSFPAGSCYRIEGTLEFFGESLQLEGNGASFRSFNAPTDQRAIWRFWNSSVALRNMTIVGSYSRGGIHDPALQHAHAVDLRGTDATISGVSGRRLAGDCVYFGLGADRSSGSVLGGSCSEISRNAVSVVAGHDVRVEGLSTDLVGFIALDVEPNVGAGNGAQRVSLVGNRIGRYYLTALSVLGNAPIDSVEFRGNVISASQGLEIGTDDFGRYRPRGISITNNSSQSPTLTPPAMNLNDVDGLTVTGNTVPMAGGTMAQITNSCGVTVGGNITPGADREFSLSGPLC